MNSLKGVHGIEIDVSFFKKANIAIGVVKINGTKVGMKYKAPRCRNSRSFAVRKLVRVVTSYQ